MFDTKFLPTIASSREEYVAIATRLAEECREQNARETRRQSIRIAALQADNDVRVVRAFEQSVMENLAGRGRHFSFLERQADR